MSKAKEILAQIKALFIEAAAPAAPATPAVPAVPAGTEYTLNDGTKITIQQAGATPAAGDTAMINGVPAGAGTYVLIDNSSITTDANGVITAVTAAQPVTADPAEMGKPSPVAPAAPAVPAAPTKPAGMSAQFEMTPEGAKSYLEAFDTGTAEDQLANLKIVCRALMEYCFGWQIRDAERKAVETQAIEVYKTGLTTAQAALSKQEQTIQAQAKVIDDQGKTLRLVFEAVEELAGTPTAEPQTLTGAKKEKFEKAKGREGRLEKMGLAAKALKTAGQPV
jgi:hypothetical protein